MTGRLVVVMAAMFASRAAAAEPTGAEILAKVEAKYAAATTYWDRGEARITGWPAPLRWTFTTAFVRPERFRFEVRDKGDAARVNVAWLEGRNAKLHVYGDGGDARDVPFASALSFAGGVVGGTVSDVPTMLLPGPDRPIWFSRLEHPKLDGTEVIDHHSTWRVVGEQDEAIVSVWVDRSTLAVRRVRLALHLPAKDGHLSLDSETLVTYDPHLDERVPDAKLAAPPPVPRPAWIGVELEHELTIVAVTRNSPAERAGLRKGDLVEAIDGFPAHPMFGTPFELLEVGKKAEISVWRGNTLVHVDVTPSARPSRAEWQNELAGLPAPAFDLAVIGANTRVRSRDFASHVGVLQFCGTAWAWCDLVAPNLERIQSDLADHGVSVISIATEATEPHSAVPRVFDPGGAVSSAYGVGAAPRIFVIDRLGVIRKVFGAEDTSELADFVKSLAK